MTENDAIEVIAIMLTAHGACPIVTLQLVTLFVMRYPEYEGLATEMYTMVHGKVERDISKYNS